MMRIAAAGVLLGVLIAGSGSYVASSPAARSMIVGWFAAPGSATVATEDWPICTAMTAMGSESDWAQLDPDFAAGKRALVVERWNEAIAALKLAALRDPDNADIQNYIGYAHWRLGQMGPAMGQFQRALMLNPRHRSAREHLGELYLTLGEPAGAEQQLAALKEICLIPCAELSGLKRAIAAHKAAGRVEAAPGTDAAKGIALAKALPARQY